MDYLFFSVLSIFLPNPFFIFHLDCPYFSHSAFAGSRCCSHPFFNQPPLVPWQNFLVFLISAHFATFKAKIRRNGSRKRIIPFYIFFRSGRLHFVKKSQYRCTYGGCGLKGGKGGTVMRNFGGKIYWTCSSSEPLF
jgi:hypothetical protein